MMLYDAKQSTNGTWSKSLFREWLYEIKRHPDSCPRSIGGPVDAGPYPQTAAQIALDRQGTRCSETTPSLGPQGCSHHFQAVGASETTRSDSFPGTLRLELSKSRAP